MVPRSKQLVSSILIRRQLSVFLLHEHWIQSSCYDRFQLEFNAIWLIKFQNLSQQYFRRVRVLPNFAGQLHRCFSQPHRKFLTFRWPPTLQLLERLLFPKLFVMTYLHFSKTCHLYVWLSWLKPFARSPYLAICSDVWFLHCRPQPFASRWWCHELPWKPQWRPCCYLIF